MVVDQEVVVGGGGIGWHLHDMTSRIRRIHTIISIRIDKDTVCVVLGLRLGVHVNN